jgi:predicted ATPase
LRQRSALVPDGAELDFLDQRGRGLPGIYDAILKRGDGTFETIRGELTKLFPTVKLLRLRNITSSELVLEIELQDGTKVAADGMSEGMLYYLAFAALRSLRIISLLAVEEPENGLHPARVAEVLRLLRQISENGTQVVIATHSPLVVNELRPEEVSVVTRSPVEGTKVKRIIDTPNFQKRSKVYELGELWLNYANGLDEAPLLKGDPA